MADWNHSSRQEFYQYYANASQAQETQQRFASVRDLTLRVLEEHGARARVLHVADIGCGAGAQSVLWAAAGHHVHGVDVNAPLLELAQQRASQAGCAIDLQVGSATSLPWADSSMDICLMPELLEHVAEWQECLRECARIVRIGGVLFLTTTNKLCPFQQEFNLPWYGWYPKPLKHYYAHLAATSHPQLANFATYPAVNWFSFYSLRAVLTQLGFHCLDRFDVMGLAGKNAMVRKLVQAVRAVPVLRFLAHVTTPYTTVVGVKLAG